MLEQAHGSNVRTNRPSTPTVNNSVLVTKRPRNVRCQYTPIFVGFATRLILGYLRSSGEIGSVLHPTTQLSNLYSMHSPENPDNVNQMRESCETQAAI